MFRGRHPLLAVFLGGCVALVVCAQPAVGDVYTVGTATDTNNVACPSAATSCSLRQLILYVEAHPFPPDTINVPAGTYTLNPGFGALVIDQSMSIVGQGAQDTVIQQPIPSDRSTSGDHVIYIAAPSGGFTPTVSISGVEIAGGDANCDSSYGPLYVPNSSCFGGDVFNAGALTLTDDWITDGFGCSGGGVANDEGTTTIERSLISGNHAACDPGGDDSGGILNLGCPTSGSVSIPDCGIDLPAHLVLDDSTVADNDARLVGGVFSWNDSNNTLLISNSTIADNESKDEYPFGTARGPGGGLGLGAGVARVQNSILAGNVESTGGATTPTNCARGAGLVSLGDNIDSGTDCGFSDTIPGQQDMSDTNPLLGPLQNNGGPTMTMALLAGSPALDRVPPTGFNCPSTDQRGVPRPQGSACDIGAYELQVAPACQGVAASTAPGGSTITVALSCTESAPGPLNYALVSSPEHGTLVDFNPSSGLVDYTPQAGYSGTDTFTYTGTNSGGSGNTATVTVTVPAPHLTPTMDWSFGATHPGYTTIRSLRVTGVISGDKLDMACSGRGCRWRSHVSAAPKSSTTDNLASLFRGWELRAHATLTVSIVKSGYVGKVYIFTFMPPRRPATRVTCVAPGSKVLGKDC